MTIRIVLLLLSVVNVVVAARAIESDVTKDAVKQKNYRRLNIISRGGSGDGEAQGTISSENNSNSNISDLIRNYDPDQQKMPSLFGPEDAQYDRYAACLAATEGLRRIRDRALEQGGKRPFRMGVASNKEPTEDQKRANAQYVLKSGEVLRALGMSVNQFNQCGRQVSEDPSLKEKVMEQAYLYRMLATLDMGRVPLIEDPSSEQLLKAGRRERVKMFCESMTEIEQLQSAQMQKLKRSLRVESLPKGVKISDPSLLPFLTPKVRAVVEAFPLQAEEIVKKHGLNSDEFNEMLSEANSNPMFRWKVENFKNKQKGKSEQLSKQARGARHKK